MESYSAKYIAYNLAEERLAPVFRDPSAVFDPAVWALLRRYMPEMHGKRICVPSSGDHHAVFAFALLGAQVTSCDIAENQLTAAQRAAQAHGMAERIRFVCSDTMRLDEIEADAYDIVYTSNGVHMWISDLDAGIRPLHLEEIMPKKDDDYPFFVKNSDVVNGNAPSREEIDRMYTIENNPGMVLPEMFCVVGQKA